MWIRSTTFIPLCHARLLIHRLWGHSRNVRDILGVRGGGSIILPTTMCFHVYDLPQIQFVGGTIHFPQRFHLLLLCALRLTSEEVSMTATSSWGVSGELSILIPLLQKRFFPKFKTRSCLANLSVVTYPHVPLSLVCLRKHVNYEPLWPHYRFICSTFPFYLIPF